MKRTYEKGLIPTDIKELDNLLKNAFGSEKESTNPTVLALRAKLPVIIGRKSEPFCHQEKELKNTEKMMKVLHDYGVVVTAEGKANNIDATIMSKYATGVLVSIMPAPFGAHKVLEPGLPTPDERFKFAKEMKDIGLYVSITGEPLLLPPREGFLERYANKCREAGADHVNFGEFRTSNPKLAYMDMKSVGLNLKDYMSHMKDHWVEEGQAFMKAIRQVGIKCSTPDWVNFGFDNDYLGCCGISKFGVHKFNFQYAMKILKERGKVSFSDIEKLNIFGEEFKEKFRKIWNDPTKYYGLKDVKGVIPLGLDGDGNRIYGKGLPRERLLMRGKNE